MIPLLLLFGALGIWWLCRHSRRSTHCYVLHGYVRARFSVGWQERMPTSCYEDRSTRRFWEELAVELTYMEIDEARRLISACVALDIQPPDWFEHAWMQRQADELFSLALAPVRA